MTKLMKCTNRLKLGLSGNREVTAQTMVMQIIVQNAMFTQV